MRPSSPPAPPGPPRRERRPPPAPPTASSSFLPRTGSGPSLLVTSGLAGGVAFSGPGGSSNSGSNPRARSASPAGNRRSPPTLPPHLRRLSTDGPRPGGVGSSPHAPSATWSTRSQPSDREGGEDILSEMGLEPIDATVTDFFAVSPPGGATSTRSTHSSVSARLSPGRRGMLGRKANGKAVDDDQGLDELRRAALLAREMPASRERLQRQQLHEVESSIAATHGSDRGGPADAPSSIASSGDAPWSQGDGDRDENGPDEADSDGCAAEGGALPEMRCAASWAIARNDSFSVTPPPSEPDMATDFSHSVKLQSSCGRSSCGSLDEEPPKRGSSSCDSLSSVPVSRQDPMSHGGPPPEDLFGEAPTVDEFPPRTVTDHVDGPPDDIFGGPASSAGDSDDGGFSFGGRRSPRAGVSSPPLCPPIAAVDVSGPPDDIFGTGNGESDAFSFGGSTLPPISSPPMYTAVAAENVEGPPDDIFGRGGDDGAFSFGASSHPTTVASPPMFSAADVSGGPPDDMFGVAGDDDAFAFGGQQPVHPPFGGTPPPLPPPVRETTGLGDYLSTAADMFGASDPSEAEMFGEGGRQQQFGPDASSAESEPRTGQPRGTFNEVSHGDGEDFFGDPHASGDHQGGGGGLSSAGDLFGSAPLDEPIARREHGARDYSVDFHGSAVLASAATEFGTGNGDLFGSAPPAQVPAEKRWGEPPVASPPAERLPTLGSASFDEGCVPETPDRGDMFRSVPHPAAPPTEPSGMFGAPSYDMGADEMFGGSAPAIFDSAAPVAEETAGDMYATSAAPSFSGAQEVPPRGGEAGDIFGEPPVWAGNDDWYGAGPSDLSGATFGAPPSSAPEIAKEPSGMSYGQIGRDSYSQNALSGSVFSGGPPACSSPNSAAMFGPTGAPALLTGAERHGTQGVDSASMFAAGPPISTPEVAQPVSATFGAPPTSTMHRPTSPVNSAAASLGMNAGAPPTSIMPRPTSPANNAAASFGMNAGDPRPATHPVSAAFGVPPPSTNQRPTSPANNGAAFFGVMAGGLPPGAQSGAVGLGAPPPSSTVQRQISPANSAPDAATALFGGNMAEGGDASDIFGGSPPPTHQAVNPAPPSAAMFDALPPAPKRPPSAAATLNVSSAEDYPSGDVGYGFNSFEEKSRGQREPKAAAQSGGTPSSWVSLGGERDFYGNGSSFEGASGAYYGSSYGQGSGDESDTNASNHGYGQSDAANFVSPSPSAPFGRDQNNWGESAPISYDAPHQHVHGESGAQLGFGAPSEDTGGSMYKREEVSSSSAAEHHHPYQPSPQHQGQPANWALPLPGGAQALPAPNVRQGPRDPRPPCAAASIGFGGKLVSISPWERRISILSVKDRASTNGLAQDIIAFPGPVDSVKPAQVLAFCGTKVAGRNGESEAERLLWAIILAHLEQTLARKAKRGKQSPEEVEAALVMLKTKLATLLRESHARDKASESVFGSGGRPSHSLTRESGGERANRSSRPDALHADAMTTMESVLLEGQFREAVNIACAEQLWGLALLVASASTDREASGFNAAAVACVEDCLPPESSLGSVVLSIAGVCNGGTSALNKAWKPSAMAILSGGGSDWASRLVEMGDQLSQGKDQCSIQAAHALYLMAGLQPQKPSKVSRLVLPGVNFSDPEARALRVPAAWDAVHMLETLELVYSDGTGGGITSIVQGHKLRLAMIMADLGYLDRAEAYMRSVRKTVDKMKGRDVGKGLYTGMFIDALAEFEDRVGMCIGKPAQSEGGAGSWFLRKVAGLVKSSGAPQGQPLASAPVPSQPRVPPQQGPAQQVQSQVRRGPQPAPAAATTSAPTFQSWNGTPQQQPHQHHLDEAASHADSFPSPAFQSWGGAPANKQSSHEHAAAAAQPSPVFQSWSGASANQQLQNEHVNAAPQPPPAFQSQSSAHPQHQQKHLDQEDITGAAPVPSPTFQSWAGAPAQDGSNAAVSQAAAASPAPAFQSWNAHSASSQAPAASAGPSSAFRSWSGGPAPALDQAAAGAGAGAVPRAPSPRGAVTIPLTPPGSSAERQGQTPSPLPGDVPQSTSAPPSGRPGPGGPVVPEAPMSESRAREDSSKKSSKGKGRKSSSSGFLTRMVSKWVFPDATVADVGDEMQAYYDEDKKCWVFPGEENKPPPAALAPPPTSFGSPSGPQPGGPAPTNDPLAALMQPPDPLASLMAPPSMSAYGPQSSARKSTPPPQYAVFKPSA